MTRKYSESSFVSIFRAELLPEYVSAPRRRTAAACLSQTFTPCHMDAVYGLHGGASHITLPSTSGSNNSTGPWAPTGLPGGRSMY